MNAWPNGTRRAMTQAEHSNWNADNWPGTRQMCTRCNEPTGRCEEDSLLSDDGDSLCEECHDKEAGR